MSLLNYRPQDKQLLQKSPGWLRALFQNGSSEAQKIQVTVSHAHSGLHTGFIGLYINRWA